MAHCQVADRGKERANPEAADGRRAEGLTRRAARGRILPAAVLLLLLAAPAARGNRPAAFDPPCTPLRLPCGAGFHRAPPVALPLPLSAQPGRRPPVAELTAALQARYDAVDNFTADFEHTYSGGVLRTSVTERGTVHIQKPGKMRWRYTWPEEKLFVSDGEKLYSYIPADRQVIVGDVPAGDTVSTPALFLAGRGRLAQDFSVAYADDAEARPGHWSLGLTPVRGDADYERLKLVVERASLRFTELRATDFQGAVSTFLFSNLRENEDLPDSLFAFEIPAGADVISDDRFGR